MEESSIGNTYRFYEDYDVFRGWASVKDVGAAALRWEISIQARETGRLIGYWDGDEVQTKNTTERPSEVEVEQARGEILRAIEGYLIDPMSTA